jgi:Neprosin
MKNRMFCKTINRVQQTIKHAIGSKIAYSATLALFMMNGLVSAQSGPTEFVPFRNFIDQTTTANASDYLGQPDSQVKDAAAFEEMRQHILNMYQDVDVNHSFVVDSSHYDCVPVMQQPAVRKYGIKKLATPPQPSVDNSTQAADDALEGRIQQAQLGSENPFDAFGNSVHCEDGTIAMRRITLDTMTHFQTLRQFFQKSPNKQILEQQTEVTPGGPAHKYSLAYQYVDNHGGQSNLNVWDPQVNTSAGEVFSLSQEWYVGGINTNVPPCGGPQSCSIQTEETGWVVYPAMFGDENPHLFIFSTPNGYASGCWDNTCGDFVVVKDGGDIGARLSPTSVLGGAQYEIALQYQFTGGNWWLCVSGTCIGYYPGSMYNGGQNTKHAQEIEFGTEAVGTTVWPPAGSGQWPSKGWEYGAYQRDLFYINDSGTSVWDSLTSDIPSPKCYSIAGPYHSTGAWSVYFYDGGPGGTGC